MLWYNGNFDGRDSQLNAYYVSTNYSALYDNFIVASGQTWTVTDVYSNDLIAVGITQAYWEIRSGVSAGNGGTLVAGGITSPASQTATGRSGFGLNEYTIDVSGISGVTLTAGTYWLTVAPVIPNGVGQAYVTTTSGAGAVGLPAGNDGTSYVYSPVGAGGENFVSTNDPSLLGPGTWDFSMGVSGTVVAVPEPSTWVLSALLVAGVSTVKYVRRGVRRRSAVAVAADNGEVTS
jgi:hypothetical protein